MQLERVKRLMKHEQRRAIAMPSVGLARSGNRGVIAKISYTLKFNDQILSI